MATRECVDADSRGRSGKICVVQSGTVSTVCVPDDDAASRCDRFPDCSGRCGESWRACILGVLLARPRRVGVASLPMPSSLCIGVEFRADRMAGSCCRPIRYGAWRGDRLSMRQGIRRRSCLLRRHENFESEACLAIGVPDGALDRRAGVRQIGPGRAEGEPTSSRACFPIWTEVPSRARGSPKRIRCELHRRPTSRARDLTERKSANFKVVAARGGDAGRILIAVPGQDGLQQFRHREPSVVVETDGSSGRTEYGRRSVVAE